MLARLGREVAEPAVHVDAHAPQQVGVALDRLVELGVEALAAVLEAIEERLVVDAGAEVGDLLDRHAAEPAIISIVPCTEWHSPTTLCCGVPWYTSWQIIAIGFV